MSDSSSASNTNESVSQPVAVIVSDDEHELYDAYDTALIAATVNTEKEEEESVVELNVGGTKFMTTRKTLCRFQDSFLEAMFSGRHSNPAFQLNDGSYFIDRDGSLFHHILNFLRVGMAVSLPRSDNDKEKLVMEADFYGLDRLVKAIQMPGIDVSQHLSDKTIWQREQEDRLRKSFASHGPTTAIFEGLILIFDEDEGMAPLTYNPDSKVRDPKYLFMDNLRTNRDNAGEAQPLFVTVKSIAEFRTYFNRVWPNVLHRIDAILLQEPVVIAGGAVLRALTASETVRTGGDWWGTKASDIDLFLYSHDPSEASRIAERIFRALASADHETWVVVRARGVINIHQIAATGHSIAVSVQIVLRLYDSPTEVLVGFDVDCCLCAYDGSNVWLAPRCISALESGTNILNPLHAWPNRPSYELRLGKYAHHGFAVLVPGIDKSRIDYDSIHRSQLRDLKGLARFIKVASEMERAPLRRRQLWNRQAQRLERIEQTRAPEQVETLRDDMRGILSPDERLVHFALGYVDNRLDRQDREVYDAITDVLVPEIYENEGSAYPLMWASDSLDEFPIALESRDEGWDEIVDGGEHCPESVPRLLLNAWDTTKRSREYLNGEMNKYDLDNLYYTRAYSEESNS